MKYRWTKWICKIAGHWMYFDEPWNCAGPSTCKLCGHKKPAIKWPDPPPMPPVKEPAVESTLSVVSNTDDYLLIAPRDERDKKDFEKMMEASEVSLWVNMDGSINGLKIWKHER